MAVTRADIATATNNLRTVAEAVARRDAAMLSLRTSSRALVQAGLFDTRAMRRREHERRTSSLWSEAAVERAHTSEPHILRLTFTVVAIR